ncbi:hypothetical protein [Trinickia violacea]|uniref:hypothetical protein n=1 Tax=Trinickia violacea TaxID=2571746 RepID=UPI0015863C87|nr:hypothetical protein [Trinickia violacea]
MRRAQPISMNLAPPLRRALIATALALLGLAIVTLCFAGYLSPAALLFLLSGSAFCG